MATLYEHNHTGDDVITNPLVEGDTYWQTFTIDTEETHTITSVKLKGCRTPPNAGGTINIDIKATSGGSPTGSALCSGTIDFSEFPVWLTDYVTDADWAEASLGAGAVLTAGIQYAIVFNVTGVIPNPLSSAVLIGEDDDNPYAGGRTGGDLPGEDLLFEEWGVPEATPPTITDQSTDTDADYQDNVSFYVTETGGDPSPTYQWYKNSVEITDETNSTLVLSSVDADDGGTYYCIATNAVGLDQSDDIVLRIVPYITAQSSSTSFSLGAIASISVTADGSPAVTYQWYKNSVAISGATSASYSFYAASSAAGTYKCTVTNAAGSVDSDDIILTIVSNPYRSYLFNLPHDVSRETS